MAVADDPTGPSCGSKLSAALATLTAYRSSINYRSFNTMVASIQP